MRCAAWDHLGQPLLEALHEVGDTTAMSDEHKAALILLCACKNYYTV